MAWINLLEAIYPIGSIYLSTSAISPSSLIGGTWTKIEEAVLRSSDDISMTYIGSDNHAITIEEIPSHQHTVVNTNKAIPIASGIGYTAPVYDTYANTNVHYGGLTGGGQEMSLVQRSFNCNMWYRTA